MTSEPENGAASAFAEETLALEVVDAELRDLLQRRDKLNEQFKEIEMSVRALLTQGALPISDMDRLEEIDCAIKKIDNRLQILLDRLHKEAGK